MRWVEIYFVCCRTPRRELGLTRLGTAENINVLKTGNCRFYKLSGAPCNDCRGDFLEVTSTGNTLPLLVGPQQLSTFCDGCWFPMSPGATGRFCSSPNKKRLEPGEK